MKISNRSTQKEYLDLGPSNYTLDEYHECLYQLDRVGKFLGGDRATYWALKQLKTPPDSIVDVGCGGGLFTIRLAKRYPKAKVEGIDISMDAIRFANEHLHKEKKAVPNIEFYVPHSTKLHYPPKSVDVVMSTLVCHHLTDHELVDFLKRAYSVARQAIILNDLHRHLLATVGFAALNPFLFGNRLVKHDGLLSIRRSFTKQDWIAFLEAAGIPLNQCSITWHWAFRWIVLVRTSPCGLK